MGRVFITVVAIAALVDLCAGAHCTDGKLEKSEIDDKILKLINDRRAKLVKGEQGNGNANDLLPKGKNMRQLEWDCDLEKEAISKGSASDKCEDPFTGTAPADKALVYHADYEYTDTKTEEVLKSLMDYIDVHPLYDVSSDVKWTNETILEDYANLMRSTASKIGCHINKCVVDGDQRYALYCLTNEKPVKEGDVIYHKDTSGAACVCDTPGFYCGDNGICISSTTSTTTTTTTAPGPSVTLPQGMNTRCMNDGMTDDLRKEFLDMHNYRRSLLAQGKVQRVNKNSYPRATNMAMLNYDCDLEKDALNYAKQCPSFKSSVGDAGENHFVVPTSGLQGWSAGLKKAVTSWWKISRQAKGSDGIGVSAVTFRQHHVNKPIATWSQMAWAKTTRLGCSIVICNNNYVSVCRYKEKGNIVGQQLYVPGQMCAACPDRCNSLGLCL